ncbi:DUF3892 domain-containing protein [Entomobacter blattae]|uniref:DUF3892 domain-containing protein n=1 Tax=Entomobacter blattae TaxID=2762277 RepID=A0A7H1NUE7_9PROT|nr:DUF3892 domain-containing protein [Entomobacter blattae]QNT79407.1 hypothetical protein JGUZn3_22060 [Entomobacter blattae]
MSEKWAKYIIVAVRYNSSDKHIHSVKRCEDLGDKLGDSEVRTKNAIVNAIENKNLTYATAYQDESGEWVEGAKVSVVVVNGKKYLRTDSNKKEEDNLGNLPEF